jgi:hypothetical protein
LPSNRSLEPDIQQQQLAELNALQVYMRERYLSVHQSWWANPDPRRIEPGRYTLPDIPFDPFEPQILPPLILDCETGAPPRSADWREHQQQILAHLRVLLDQAQRPSGEIHREWLAIQFRYAVDQLSLLRWQGWRSRRERIIEEGAWGEMPGLWRDQFRLAQAQYRWRLAGVLLRWGQLRQAKRWGIVPSVKHSASIAAMRLFSASR